MQTKPSREFEDFLPCLSLSDCLGSEESWGERAALELCPWTQPVESLALRQENRLRVLVNVPEIQIQIVTSSQAGCLESIFRRDFEQSSTGPDKKRSVLRYVVFCSNFVDRIRKRSLELFQFQATTG